MTAAALSARRPELAIRTVTGIGLAAVAFACIIVGQTTLWGLLAVAGFAMMVEWAGLVGAPRWQTWVALLGLAAPLLVQEPHVDVPANIAFDVLLVATLLVMVITRNPRLTIGLLYVGLPTLALLYIHDLYNGIDLTFWTLAIVVATDIGAYFAGRTFGGPKLAPMLSPNKTWSGLIGGIVAATIAGFLMARWLHVSTRLPGFAGLLAVAAQAGDLYESAMKRRANVKDSGHILPGHGGAMDRFDGMVPVACIVALITLSGL